MSESIAHRPRILLVLTREIPSKPNSGRERTLSFIRRSLAANNDVSSFELVSAMQKPRATRALKIVSRLLRGLIRGQPCPLQVALFSDGSDFSKLHQAIADTGASAVYFDSVRTLDWLLATREKYPQLRLICDFDDLMSLRFARLLERDLPISLGYLENATPRWLSHSLKRSFVARGVLRYEANALRSAEKLAVQAADAVSLVSSADIERMREDVGPALALKTYVIPPGVSFPKPSLRTQRCREFIFVGSDSLLQNRLTIEFLLNLWSTTSPAIPLRIVGRMLKSYTPCDGVTFAGFVSDLDEVYGDDVIALCPSFVEGGIKTKVLEALGQGVIPVGNAMTFEGMGCEPGCLAMTDQAIGAFVAGPESRLEQLRGAAIRLRECVYSRYSLDAVTDAWSRVVIGSQQVATAG